MTVALVLHPEARARAAIAEMLEASADMQVAQAVTLQEALDLLAGIPADVVVLSNFLGEQCVTSIKRRHPRLPIISLMAGSSELYLWPPVTGPGLAQAVQSLQAEPAPCGA